LKQPTLKLRDFEVRGFHAKTDFIMPFDNFDPTLGLTADPAMAAFHGYARRHYMQDAGRLVEIDGWFHELYALRETGMLDVEPVHVTGVLKPYGYFEDYSFDAFRIGEMYFSNDPGVLMLPYPRLSMKAGEGVLGAQTVGNWLHHFPVPPDELAFCHSIMRGEVEAYHDQFQFEENRYTLTRGAAPADREVFFQHLAPDELFPAAMLAVFKRLEQEAIRKDIPATGANTFVNAREFPLSEKLRLELPGDNWSLHAMHRDEKQNSLLWSRAWIHTPDGPTTLYKNRIGAKEFVIPAFPGGTSSHVSIYQDGVEHTGRDGINGRVVLIAQTGDAKLTMETPWRIEPAPLAALAL
jgi:hypothetical protein